MPIQHVGRPLKRLEDAKLIQGRDAYVNDVRLTGALSLAFTRSPRAHALIRRVDATATKKIPDKILHTSQPLANTSATNTHMALIGASEDRLVTPGAIVRIMGKVSDLT